MQLYNDFHETSSLHTTQWHDIQDGTGTQPIHFRSIGARVASSKFETGLTMEDDLKISKSSIVLNTTETPVSQITSESVGHTRLASCFHDQKVHVPDLLGLYTGNRVRRNSSENISKLRIYLLHWYHEFVPTGDERDKQLNIDVATAAAYVYTNATMEKLKPVGALIAWLFFWDDEIDCGRYSEDSDGAISYCNDSITFIRQCLTPEYAIATSAAEQHHNCETFVDIGRVISEQPLEDRDRFTTAIIDLIAATRDGNTTIESSLPTVEAYLEHRIRTVGTDYICHSMVWVYDLHLPSQIWKHHATARIIREVAIQSAIANDIISLSKEVQEHHVVSIVPILVHNLNISVQQAIDEAVAMMKISCRDFQDACHELQQFVADEESNLKQDVQIWIESVRDVLVGGMVCQLNSPRYLPRSAFDEDGMGFTVTL